ncbi:MAG: hypothetical protein WBL25_11890, partial [Anaerolineales bacterium]
ERSNLLRAEFSRLGGDCFGKKRLAMTSPWDFDRKKIQMRLPYLQGSIQILKVHFRQNRRGIP